MEVKAYAKINLTLDVTGRRPDGFHTLDTVMQSVSIYDKITLTREKEPGVRLGCNKDYLPVDRRNTAYKAACGFFSHCGLTREGLAISIEKTIPSRAGMGGGSADAAAVLHGLNVMFEANLSLQELMHLGGEIGADVPFCVRGGAARCRGIGELLSPVPMLPECWLAVCKPPAGMSTPRAYALIDKYPLTRNLMTPAMLTALESGDLSHIGRCLGNRFDETMRLMQVKDIKKTMLSAGAMGAMMTGSGSAVFALFDHKEKAQNCLSLLEDKGKTYLAVPVKTGVEISK